MNVPDSLNGPFVYSAVCDDRQTWGEKWVLQIFLPLPTNSLWGKASPNNHPAPSNQSLLSFSKCLWVVARAMYALLGAGGTAVKQTYILLLRELIDWGWLP